MKSGTKITFPLFACTRLGYLLFVKNEYTFYVLGKGSGTQGKSD
jgi:hypothetical protein